MTLALRTEGLSKHWGAFHANSDVSLVLEGGARHALIGPNGAGKTTFINLLTGVLTPNAGEIYLGETRIKGPHFQRKRYLQPRPAPRVFVARALLR